MGCRVMKEIFKTTPKPIILFQNLSGVKRRKVCYQNTDSYTIILRNYSFVKHLKVGGNYITAVTCAFVSCPQTVFMCFV
jgi:hypothetical protein